MEAEPGNSDSARLRALVTRWHLCLTRVRALVGKFWFTVDSDLTRLSDCPRASLTSSMGRARISHVHLLGRVVFGHRTASSLASAPYTCRRTSFPKSDRLSSHAGAKRRPIAVVNACRHARRAIQDTAIQDTMLYQFPYTSSSASDSRPHGKIW